MNTQISYSTSLAAYFESIRVPQCLNLFNITVEHILKSLHLVSGTSSSDWLLVSQLVSVFSLSIIIYIFMEISTHWQIPSKGYTILITYLLIPLNYTFLSILTTLIIQISYQRCSFTFSYKSRIFLIHFVILSLSLGIYCIIEIIHPGTCGLISSSHLSMLLFNQIYFDVISSHRNEFLWDWIHTHCPSSLHYDNCFKPFSFSPSNCAADINTCNLQLGLGFACPYSICSTAVSQVTETTLIVIFSILSLVLILLSCSLYTIHRLYKEKSTQSKVSSLSMVTMKNHSLERRNLNLLPHYGELVYISSNVNIDLEGALLKVDLSDYAEFIVDETCTEHHV